MSSVVIAPSLPANSFREIESLCTALDGVAQEMQIDIVDGDFAPFVSWPFTESDPLQEFQKLSGYTSNFLIEIDCMVSKPEQYLDAFVSLGVSRVAIHVGSTEKYDDIITHAQTYGYKVGFALTNDTSLEVLLRYIDDIDYVQLMGIKEVGQQGQPFDERTLERARGLHSDFPDLEIAVDGSVNMETISLLYAAGVTRFAPGSAITKASNPAIAYKQLLSKIT